MADKKNESLDDIVKKLDAAEKEYNDKMSRIDFNAIIKKAQGTAESSH